MTVFSKYTELEEDKQLFFDGPESITLKVMGLKVQKKRF